MRYRTLAAVILLLASMMGAVLLIAEETGADAPIAPTMRYVSPTGSTYMTIQDAVDDAMDGDTIIVGNGTYSENVQITTSNLTIMGNSTSGVNISSAVMTFYLGSVTNVTLTNMNISSTNSQAMRIFDSDNITLMGLTLWSEGGTDGCFYIDTSENVTADLDWFTFTPFIVHAEGDGNNAIKLYSTKDIFLLFVDISSQGDSSHGVATYTENERVAVVYSSIMATGANSDSFHCQGELLMIASGFMEMHGDDFIDISDGRFMTIDTDVPDTDVNVGANAVLGVFYDRFLTVYDEEGNGVENVEVKLEDQMEGVVYSTPFFGGSDVKSDMDGMVESISCLQKYFDGSNTPQWGNNYLSLFYADGDIPVSMNIMIDDANTTDDLDVILSDFDIPDEAVNVEAVTISHEQIDLSFEASTALDIDHYEVWVNSGSGMTWDFNTTIPGTFPYMALIPDTTYSFQVISVDDDGLMSDGVVVANTTNPPVNGTIEGMIEYMAGPMDGMAAEAAMVVVSNSTGIELANITTGVSGMYNFQEVPFGDNYIMTVYPFGYVLDGGMVSGYLVWTGPFDHHMDMMMNVSLYFYSYDRDDISGVITYEGGSMDGMNATDALVTLYNQTMVQIDQVTIGTDGMYLFEDVPFGNGYTVKITPDNAVIDMGTVSGYLEKSVTFDHNGVTQEDVMLHYYEYIYVTDDIHGMVTYNGGTMDGMNATNATVHLLNESMVVIAEFTTNETGMYIFQDVEFGVNYSIRIIPQDSVADGGEVSGYMANVSDLFNHTGILEMDFELEYYEYIPPAPTTGPIMGMITYKEGAKDGQPMIGATVSIVNAAGAYTNRTTNSTGHYKVVDMPFGPYTITVFPPAADEAVLNEKSGYLAEEFDTFTLNSATGVTKDYELVYYEYIPPVVEHPSLIIKDKDGNPIPGVFVTVTVGENIYTATTDADGKATFTELEGTAFPSGANYMAEKTGYDTLEWEGDTVPAMKEKKDKETDDSNLLLFIIIAVVVLVILIILFLLVRKKGDEGGWEE